MPPPPGLLRALVVDDEQPALAELVHLLSRDERIGTIQTASDGADALKILQAGNIDVMFCDIKMPGLDGMDLARLLSKFATAPQVVFVTAYEQHAAAAFDLHVTDYVMKPVREARLAEAVRRVACGSGDARDAEDEVIAIEVGRAIRFVQLSSVRFVVAQGDYARLHTASGSHLIRVPLSVLEDRWRGAGFARIHRSTLIALAYVEEVSVEPAQCLVRLGDDWLRVSRRHTRELRDLLLRSNSLRS
ncbi:LytR/AlgR family response regulator transcription factor [Kribbella sp. NPDC050124]|uniref:LytR/AlgR family response regulator transcription factor n=1 Tax=Kribbella sp. NPDC050124 TaxID=3364114 RepID=UPI0037BAF269